MKLCAHGPRDFQAQILKFEIVHILMRLGEKRVSSQQEAQWKIIFL